MYPTRNSASNLVALFGVHQNVSDLVKQIAVYANIGFVVDTGVELAHGEVLPDAYFTARGIERDDLKESVAMRLPEDPFMHIWFQSWHNLDTKSQWPPKWNQIGCRGLTLLVDDVDLELTRIRNNYSDTVELLQAAIVIERKWGPTKTALLRDPDGNFLELVAIEGSPQAKIAKPVPNDASGFLHFMVNCVEYERMKQFYRSFGMRHDPGVDFRVDGWPDGLEHFKNQYQEGFGKLPMWGECDFLHGERDPSYMHLELLESKSELQLPGLNPTWGQRGIARYCLKVPSFEQELRKVKQRGNHIYIEQQKAGLKWGDSTWTFSGDDDGHIVTLEQWMPHRYWGTKEF